MTIKRVLIANRGEIAVRIIRACKDMGIESVQVYSEADKETLAVQMADFSVGIGGSQPSESYLSIDKIINAAKEMGVDAIHPGYGFLAENADFSDACKAHGFRFIGPEGSIIRLMGDKAQARELAVKAGVPVTPGSNGVVSNVEQVTHIASEIGFPILIKASAGGGGRGMRVVERVEKVKEAFESASQEALAAFGCSEVYVEKYLPRVHHVEVQVFGDGERVVHMGERDCSAQRRHQKLVEESPFYTMSESKRVEITRAACKLAEQVSYKGAGTVEFIVDADTHDFYFIEMNARIQVEHPVTEAVTGLDLVKEQIHIAAGKSLSISQEEIQFFGHAIECRINAENPDKGFMPQPGKLTKFVVPLGPGIRVETHAYPDYILPPYYDSLLAKVIAYGRDREEAISRMRRALGEFLVEGVPTTISFHQRFLEEPEFLEGKVYTRFIKEVMWAGDRFQNML